MASKKLQGIMIEINGNTTKLTDSLKSAYSVINSTNTELKNLQNALKLDPKNVELLSQKQEVLKKNIEATKEKLDKLKTAQSQMGEYNNLTEEQKEKYRELSVEISKTESTLKSLNEEYKNFGSVSSQKIVAVGQDFENIGEKVSSVGKKITPASIAVAGLGTVAVKTAADFDSAMSKVQAISGSSKEELESLRKKAEEMGEKTKFSAAESAEALQYMAMAGWKADDMLNGLEGIMNLAAASGEELATTSDIVTDALTAFGMQANESAHFADILAIASSNSNTNVSMMGETFKHAASIAGSLGYTAEDTALAIGLMANAGIKSGQAGTALRNIMTRLAADTNGARSAMEELGITVVNSDGSMQDFGEVIAELRVKFKSLSEVEQANLAKIVAGQTALSGFLAIANSSDADFEKLSNAIKNCDGASEEMANTMNDNLNGQLTLLKSKLEGIAISIGEKIIPFILKIIEKAGVLLDWFNNLNPIIENLLLILGGIVAISGPLLIFIGNIISAIGTILKIIPEITPIIDVITGAVKTLFGVIMEHPVIAIVTAIVGIIIYLWNNCEWFRDGVLSLLQKISDVVKNVFEIFKNIILNIVNTISTNFTKISNKINEFNNFVKKIMQKVKDIFINGWNSIIDFFKTIPSKMLDIGGQLMSGLVEGIKQKWNNLKGSIENLGKGIVDKFKNVFGIHSPSKIMKEQIGKNLGLGMVEGIESTISDIEDAMKGLNYKVQTSINPIINPNAISKQMTDNKNYKLEQPVLEIDYDAMAIALAKELSKVKMVVDDEVLGNFVDERVTEQIYS